MNRMKLKMKLLTTLFLLTSTITFSQNDFQIVGNAFGINDIVSVACDEVDTCFTLTQDIGNQAGAVWDLEEIDLSKKFDALFCLTLGSNDATGADGFAFVLRGLSSATLGDVGGGIGYLGIQPSVAIEFDTWDNGAPNDDIPDDHTGMYANGNFVTPLVSATPLTSSASNVEDGNYHTTRIVWDPVDDSLKMYFDGTLRMAYQGDIINNVFGGANLVYWGFTASTGGSMNLQQICFPYRSIHLPDTTICQYDSVPVSFYTEDITSYTWHDISGDTIVDWDAASGTSFDLNDTLFYAFETNSYILDIEFNNNFYSDTMDVVVIPLPQQPFADLTVEFCPDLEQFILSAENDGFSYLWSPGGETTQQIVVSEAGWNGVTITEPINQCTNKDSIYISLFCDPIVDVPNVITPNGDGVNDVYQLISKTDEKWVANAEFIIVNRWGNEVYSIKGGLPVWDGTASGKRVKSGVYFYRGSYTDTRDNNKKEIDGFITVIGEE